MSSQYKQMVKNVARRHMQRQGARALSYDPVVVLAGVVGRMAQALGRTREEAHAWLQEALAHNWSSGATAGDFKAIRRAIERPYGKAPLGRGRRSKG